MKVCLCCVAGLPEALGRPVYLNKEVQRLKAMSLITVGGGGGAFPLAGKKTRGCSTQ